MGHLIISIQMSGRSVNFRDVATCDRESFWIPTCPNESWKRVSVKIRSPSNNGNCWSSSYALSRGWFSIIMIVGRSDHIVVGPCWSLILVLECDADKWFWPFGQSICGLVLVIHEAISLTRWWLTVMCSCHFSCNDCRISCEGGYSQINNLYLQTDEQKWSIMYMSCTNRVAMICNGDLVILDSFVAESTNLITNLIWHPTLETQA